MSYENFINDGYMSLGQIIPENECDKLYDKLLKSRDWSSNLFRSKEEVEKKLLPDKTAENPRGGTNPGKGKCNFAEELNLDFLEKNENFIKAVNDICGNDPELLLKKFVVAVPADWIPEWLKIKMKQKYIDNVNAYIKEEYRDVTYFRGIDYHMDYMDQIGTKADMITVYVYLNNVTEKMSPLHVIKKSHEYCHTVFPHYYENETDKSIILGEDSKNKKKFNKEILVGNTGSVFIWSSLTMHRTKPFKSSDLPRISLRYTFRKNSKNKNNFKIDEFLLKHSLENFSSNINNTVILKEKFGEFKNIDANQD